MQNDRSDDTGRDVVLDIATRLKKAEMDRRQFLLRATAAGLSAPAFAAGLRVRGVDARVQDAKGTLVTVSQEQQPTWIRNFNPLLADGSSRWPTQAGIYEPLIIYNTMKGEIAPWLATKYEFSADNKTLTFTIRDEVKWSDGQPFTAKDVLFTHNLLQKNEALPGTGGVRSVYPYISDVKAPDDKTVVFTFKQVFTPGLYDIGEQSIVPEHLWKDVDDPVTFTNENPVGTGPFTEVGRFEAQYWEIHRNPSYWQEGKPSIEGLRFPAYPSNDAANLATLNGENDWAANFIPDIDKTYVAKDPEHYHWWFPSTGATVHLYTNTTRKPFDDPNVRKAISMAINREQIVQIAMYDYTHPSDSTGLSDAYEKWKNADAAGADWVKMDVDKANELLDAAGLKKDGDTRSTADGKPMTYDLNVVSGWSDWVQSCEIMAKNLSEIGIKAEVKTYDFAAWFDRVQKGDFDLSIGWSSGGPTPFNFYRGVMSSTTAKPIGELGSENWHRFTSPEADKLLDQFAGTSDEAEQKKIASELQMIYMENAPGIPLFPGPQWGEYNDTRFTGFPSEEDPYALLSTYESPERLFVLTTIKPVGS